MPQFPVVRNHAPWHKTLLIPLWILQLAFMIAVFALGIASLTNIGNYRNYLYGDAASYAESNSGATTTFGVDTGLSATTMVLTLVEVFQLANRSLKPAMFLLTNMIKVILFIALVGLDGAGIGKGYDRHRAGGIAAFALDIMVLLTILTGLLYATIVLIKNRAVVPDYGYVGQEADKPNTAYSTSPVPMTTTVPNTIIVPDITYGNHSSIHQLNPHNGQENYHQQTTGVANSTPSYGPYYARTDSFASVDPRIHEMEQFGNQTHVSTGGETLAACNTGQNQGHVGRVR